MKREAAKTIPPPALVVSPSGVSQRLDKFLIQKFPETHRKFWKENLTRLVRVNSRKVAPSYTLREGDVIQFLRPVFSEPPELHPNPKLSLKILFKDRWLIAVDKPAGIPCYPLQNQETSTVANALAGKFPEQARKFVGPIHELALQAGLIHRLDNDTSGVLLFARNPEALAKFSALNRGGKIDKFYLAWVLGAPISPGRIRSPIAHHPKKKNRMVVASSPEEAKRLKARPALTEYQVLETRGACSLLSIKIHKGSRHQIRVHLATIGHPIVGDKIYGGKGTELLGRHLLHAQRVEFEHPFTKKKIVISAPVPEDFKRFEETVDCPPPSRGRVRERGPPR